MTDSETRQIDFPDCSLEVAIGGPEESEIPVVCAAHPAGAFGVNVVELLNWTTNARTVCVNPRGIGNSSPVTAGQHSYGLEKMVEDIEQVRRSLGVDRWVFWGMSGGGWLGQIYAHLYPESLSGLVLESVCACFRERLSDPNCVLSPFYPSWQPELEQRGLMSENSHSLTGDVNATEWIDIERVGAVFRRSNGPALLVSPMHVTPEMRAAMPVLWSVETRPWLRQICKPTLVIGGTSDPIVPVKHVKFLHEHIRGSQLLLVRDGGHAPVTQRRTEMAEEVRRFLGSLR